MSKCDCIQTEAPGMGWYSEKDIQDATKFRNRAHREALAKVREIRPDIGSVVDRHPVEAYFRQVWDYPGAWYTYVSVPEGFGSWDELVEAIVRDTLAKGDL
ncbi:MAG: hypothetical protein Q4A07_06475 [Coriobacteriales bacterium]|nr:hypothetical protein [Coriobacteriales bacterium]